MSQATTNAVSTPPTAAPASPPSAPPPSVVNYKPRPAPAPRRLSWLTPRVVLFALVFGSIVGFPLYSVFDYVHNQGMHTRADGVIEVDLKAMSVFPLDQQVGRTEDVPERFRALDGKKISLIGEMYAPNASGEAVGQFDLVYSIAKCCFSGPPQVQHFVKSTPRQPGAAMPFYGGPVRVTGTLSVGVQRDVDKVTSVYRLTVDAVEAI